MPRSDDEAEAVLVLVSRRMPRERTGYQKTSYICCDYWVGGRNSSISLPSFCCRASREVVTSVCAGRDVSRSRSDIPDFCPPCCCDDKRSKFNRSIGGFGIRLFTRSISPCSPCTA